MNNPAMGVINPIQLNRIEAVHRGFLYQHLYAVGCLIGLISQTTGSVAVERDEDIEITTDDEIIFIQVKTRSSPLRHSDINTALQCFDKLRRYYAEKAPNKPVRFAIVSNTVPGPKLATAFGSKNWPDDIELVFPGSNTQLHSIAPPAWKSIGEAVEWCMGEAAKLPFVTLMPETLVWKLAACVQFAATGEDAEREGHQFSRGNLSALFEFLVEQLQEFPSVPDDYRPQQDEPALLSDARIRLIVGFSGAGKTVWASSQAQHSSAATAYYDVGGLPGGALATSLARELVAQFLPRQATGSAMIPAATGLDALRALSHRLDLPEMPLVVIDNIHRIDPEDIRSVVTACPNIRFILMGQPCANQGRLEGLLEIEAESLRGWNADTVAAVFVNEGARISPEFARRWRDLTSGLPLYVKNAASLCVRLHDGNASAFAMEVQKGRHAVDLAQETILQLTIETLSEDEKAVVAALSCVNLQLKPNELSSFLTALPTPPREISRVLRSLQRKGLVEVYASGGRKLHDAVHVPAATLLDQFSVDEFLTLQTCLRDILFVALQSEHDLARLGAWLRLLAPTGQTEVLVDLATNEIFHEIGAPSDLKAVLLATANDTTIEPSLLFWTLDALVFWEFLEDEHPRDSFSYLQRMETIFSDAHLGTREGTALAMKQMLFAGISKDRSAADAAFKSAKTLCAGDPQLMKINQYNYASALFRIGHARDALPIAESLYAMYYDVLNLDPTEIFGATHQQIIAMFPDGISDYQDDLKHLADCLNLVAMCKRHLNQPPLFTAIHAAKFYKVSESHRSEMKAAQDVADDFISMGEVNSALQVMEDHVLPLLSYFGFEAHTMDIRGQYAVVQAYNGKFEIARSEMAQLEAYVADLPPAYQEVFSRQRDLIEDIAANRISSKQRPSTPRSDISSVQQRRTAKVGRNEPCPCGSGLKYKKCCLI